jgi:hypothetical protein
MRTTVVEFDYVIPAPRFIAARGCSQLSPYLIMTGIAGSTVADIWECLARLEQLAIAREIGTITAAIYNLPKDGLAEVEQQFGDWNEYIKLMQAERITEIEATETLSTRQWDALLLCLIGEALQFLDEPPVLTNSDFSLQVNMGVREADTIMVTGFIVWAEAMLGPAEWDIAFHWFWTLNQDH